MEERPLIRPGHGASHTESFADPALIWQVAAAHRKCLLLRNSHAPVLHATWWLDVLEHTCHPVQCWPRDNPADTGCLFSGWPGGVEVGSVHPLGGKAWMRAQMRFTQDIAAPGALMTTTLPANARRRGVGGTLSPLPAICRDVTAAALVLVAGQPCRVSVSKKSESVSFGGLMPTMKDFCFLGIQRGV